MHRVTFRHHNDLFVYPLPATGRTVIGSSAGADVTLPVAEVSRRHAEIEHRDGKLILRDLDSRNGTFVDGIRIREVALPPLAAFSLGPVAGVVEEISTSDIELAWSPSPSDEAQALSEATVEPPSPSVWLVEVIEPALASLRHGVAASAIARDAGVRLLAAADGAFVSIVNHAGDDSALLFEGGCAPEGGVRTLEHAWPGGVIRAQAAAHPEELVWRATLQALVEVLAAALASSDPHPHVDDRDDLTPGLWSLVGASAPMTALRRRAARVAAVPINVLLVGESGTGKELLARELHAQSSRAAGPFVAVNCAALPRDLLEAELFGIEERVATGVASRPGRFELASGGTLFLDEVCDMAVESQAMILRALQERQVYRIGGNVLREADVRVIAATNKNVHRLLSTGELRSDLYYRLAGDIIKLPPLRERPGDVSLLVHHFITLLGGQLDRSVRGISRKALAVLVSYSWPGNVRELENEIRRALALAPASGVIDTSHLSPTVMQDAPVSATTLQTDEGLMVRLAAVERRIIESTLALEAGSVTAAAKRLDISRAGLYQRMERLGILPGRR